ncbi:MAG: alpha/beta fold hydrolase [Myxococcota bacterium]
MKAPVVLVHGAGGNAASWAPVQARWPDTVAVDLPGRADAGPTVTTIAALAEGLARSLEAPSTVIGHSMGGAVAMQLALDHPERVARLVLVNTGARLRVSPAILGAVGAATPDVPFRVDLAFGSATDPSVVDANALATASVPIATTLADWRACDGFDLRDRIGAITTPTRVLGGELDAVTPPRFQAWLAEALPNASLHLLPDVGHMLPWERPGGLAEAVTGTW